MVEGGQQPVAKPDQPGTMGRGKGISIEGCFWGRHQRTRVGRDADDRNNAVGRR